MTRNECAIKYQKGVENLLDLPIDFDYDRFYKVSKKTNDYGGEIITSNLDKCELANYLISLPNESLTQILKNVKSEINIVLENVGE